MPSDWLQALWDPTAPLPAGWPAGALGAFLLFLVPIGGGIPFGVLMARDAGVSPALTALLYFISDVAGAFAGEPYLIVLRWVGRRFAPLAAVGRWLTSLSRRTGLREAGRQGVLRLVLLSFAVSPGAGRAAAATAGHGFVSGWAVAITGDMAYFVLLMASTLWLSAVLGDERLTVGAVLVAMSLLPFLLRRLHAPASKPPTEPEVVPPPASPARSMPPTLTETSAPPRRDPSRAGRRGRKR